MLFLSGCGSNIPNEVEVYLDSFVREAELRGHNVSNLRDGLTIQFTDLPDNKAGSSQSFLFRKTIKLAPLIWKQMNERQREMLVFHELGHCVLGRQHKNDKLLLGECASIMKEGGENACVANVFSESWRSYYIDELFNPQVPEPVWYKTIDLAQLNVIDTLVQKGDSLLSASSQAAYYGIIGRLPLKNAVDDYLLELEYDSLNHVYGFAVNGLTISFSQENGVFSVSHVGKLDWMSYSFCSEEILPEVPIEFSLLKLGTFYHFYVNGIEKHVMSMDYFQIDATPNPDEMQFVTYGGSKPIAKFTALRIDSSLD